MHYSKLCKLRIILSIYKHVPKEQIFNGLMFVKRHFLHILEQRDIEGIFINKKASPFKENVS